MDVAKKTKQQQTNQKVDLSDGSAELEITSSDCLMTGIRTFM